MFLSEYEMVRLKRSQSGLEAGAVGTILMGLPVSPDCYTVEFADKSGVTIALLTLYDDDLEPLSATDP
jgi:hypothetical protein